MSTLDIPKLPVDKSVLPSVAVLDQMITDAFHLSLATDELDKAFQQLETVCNEGDDGSQEGAVRRILRSVDAIQSFEEERLPSANKAAEVFKEKYVSADEFTYAYREKCRQVETEISENIEDKPLSRHTLSKFNHHYPYRHSNTLYFMETRLTESSELKSKLIESELNSVGVDLMVADYRKGKDLVDLLQSSQSKLELLRPLDPENQEIDSALTNVAEKKTSRMAEIEKARQEYRFPARFDGAGSPENPEELEDRIAKVMRSYDLHCVRVASGWTEVRSVLGVHLYNQMDFYVASASSENDNGVLDVLLVTGKTGSKSVEDPFAKYSVGVVAQMKNENLA